MKLIGKMPLKKAVWRWRAVVIWVAWIHNTSFWKRGYYADWLL